MLDKIIDKLSWIIAYMLPITYPIHYFKMKALDKKATEKKERSILEDKNTIKGLTQLVFLIYLLFYEYFKNKSINQ